MPKKQKKQNNLDSGEGRIGLVYARVSSKRQEIEGSGLQSQGERCIAELKALGVPYDRSFLDSYTGGGDFMLRPAMRDMLAYIDQHPSKRFLVIFDDLKRFARDVKFHLELRTAFKAREVMLKCLNYNFDESEEGQFVEVILAAGAELERKQNKRQVIQKMEARLKAGYWPFGGKKGYKIIKDPAHGKLAVPYEPEASLLKIALEGFAQGQFVRKLDACEYLVNCGFWQKQHPKKYIDKFSQMLEDPFYAGYVEYLKPRWNVERCLGKHQPIISMATFELNQKRLHRNGFSKKIRADASEEFPLRGCLVCASCGKHVGGAWSSGRSGRYAYYFCMNPNCEYSRKSIPKKQVEDGFKELLRGQAIKNDVAKIVELVFERVWSEEVDIFEKGQLALLQKKEELQRKIGQLTEMIMEAKTDSLRQAFEKQIEKITKELEEVGEPAINLDLSIDYRTALDKALTLLKSPLIAWDYLSFLEKQQLFFFVFQEKLPFDAEKGYRTDNISSTVRLFEGFATANPLDVDLVSKNWNHLHSFIFEASEAILGGRDVRKGMILVGISR